MMVLATVFPVGAIEDDKNFIFMVGYCSTVLVLKSIAKIFPRRKV